MREQEAGFGVGQQLSTETGTRKIGIEARDLTQRWAARGEAFQQTNFRPVPTASSSRPERAARRRCDRERRRQARDRRLAAERRATLRANEPGRQPDVLRDRVTCVR